MSTMTSRTQQSWLDYTLSADAPVDIRPATADDLAALVALHERCSDSTLRARYMSSRRAGPGPITTLLERTLTYVAECDGELIAMGNLHVDGAEAELALLVEDRWQGCGVGWRVGAALAQEAVCRGASSLTAATTASNLRVHDLLRRSGLPMTVSYDRGTASVTCDLTAG